MNGVNYMDKYASINKEKKSAERLVKIGGFILVLGGIAYLALMGDESLTILAFLLLVPGFIVSAIGASQFMKVKKRFKIEFLVDIIKQAMPDAVYQPEAGLSPQEVYQTEFLKRADRFHSEDLMYGTIEDVAFRASDVKLEERHVQHTKNGTRVYYVAYFLGRVFHFTFNKEFEGYLQVLESGSPLVNRGFKKVELESVDFNKKFRTFSSSDLSAFYVLTPDIMERIMDLEKSHPGRIGFSFNAESLYIAINNNKDTFELKMFKPVDDQMVDEFRKDLDAVRQIVLLLKLNSKIFKSSTK
jgi:UPF0716 family protein affecting phage T7 exclusion